MLLALLVAVGLFWHTIAVYPLRLLVVFFHELSHALASLLTGGQGVRIELVAQEGGLAVTRGGSAFAVLSAGYLGSLLWGIGLLLAAVRTRADSAITLAWASCCCWWRLLWVRPVISFGFGFSLLAGAALVLAGLKLPAAGCDFLLKLIGLASIMYVPLDIIDDTLRRAYLPSDAAMLGELTLIPGVVWGTLWMLLAVVAGGWALWQAVTHWPAEGKPDRRKTVNPLLK